MSFTKQSNRLDDALIAGHITHDQYLAAGGRTPETMLRGLREGSDALVKRHGIREIRSLQELLSPETQRRNAVHLFFKGPRFHKFLPEDRVLRPFKGSKNLRNEDLDFIYSEIKARHPSLLKTIESITDDNMVSDKKSALETFLNLRDRESRNAYSLDDSHVFTPKANSGTLGGKLKSLIGLRRKELDAEFEAEIARRHEIDEIRYQALADKTKKRLMSTYHAHPRVILNEHAALVRAPKSVREGFIDLRTGTKEVPGYWHLSGKNFLYGKGFSRVPVKPGGSYDFNAAKRIIENSIADIDPDSPSKSLLHRNTLVSRNATEPSWLKKLISKYESRARNSLVSKLMSAQDGTLLNRISNLILKHAEYSPDNKSHLKTAYEMGAQEALRRAGI